LLAVAGKPVGSLATFGTVEVKKADKFGQK